jgi:hypothetical protein
MSNGKMLSVLLCNLLHTAEYKLAILEVAMEWNVEPGFFFFPWAISLYGCGLGVVPYGYIYWM